MKQTIEQTMKKMNKKTTNNKANFTSSFREPVSQYPEYIEAKQKQKPINVNTH
jgi:hypothetical protein